MLKNINISSRAQLNIYLFDDFFFFVHVNYAYIKTPDILDWDATSHMQGQRPQRSNSLLFEGLTFTTTNLTSKEKSHVAEIVSFMGGKLDNNLTSETKVLVVGSLETAKTRYCLTNRTDVTLLYPDDLYEIYKRFKEKNIPEPALQILDDYPWPIFDATLFCLSRLRDVSNPCFEKNYITKLIHHFGGKAISSLTPKVKYLITEKKEGKRYESAVEWNIPAIHPRWIIDCCNCQRILDPRLYDISKVKLENIGKNAYVSHRNVVDYGTLVNNPIYKQVSTLNKSGSNETHLAVNPSISNSTLFSGFIFTYFGFNEQQTKKLSDVLKENGAEIQEEYDLTVMYVIVPSTCVFDNIPEHIKMSQGTSDTRIVNEWFIERCLHYGKIMYDSWSSPPRYLNLNYQLKIHITGFSEMEHLHITKLIRNLNLTFSMELTEDCDFLVANLTSLGLTKSNSPQLFKYKCPDILTSKSNMSTSNITLTKKKINSAKNWDIPVVSLAFIWEISQTGILPHILDTKWCIFAPRSMRPASNFLSYARSLSGGTFRTQNPNTQEESLGSTKYQNTQNSDIQSKNQPDSTSRVPVPLPSPRKSSPKKWPKLIGTASESQLKSISMPMDDDYDFRSARRTLFSEDKERKVIEFEDDFGDDLPVFKKRRL